MLHAARESRSGALVVRGEAGIGKTALLQHAVTRAEGMRVLTSAGIEAEAELPFAGLHQLLWPIIDLADELPEVQSHALRGAFGLSADRVEDRFLVSVAVLGLLTAAADAQPLLCVIDDAHWLDGASADALVFVTRRLHADPIAVLIGAREGDARHFEAPGLPELSLAGLRGAQAAALLDGALPAVVREELVGVTGGNPLALLELPAALTDDELAGRAPLRLDLPLNERIEQAFLARVSPLADDARRMLLLAAADDSGEVGTLLRAAEGVGVGPDALDAVERAGLLSADGPRVRFRHPLLRSAVYRAAGFAERRAAHQALAASLDRDADADRRAWHRAAAATAPDDEAAEALARTADHAASRGGHTAAARALERAAELDSDPQRRALRLVAAAGSSALAGRVGHAVALLDRAEPDLRDPMARGMAMRVRGMASMAIGRPADAYAMLADAARTVLPADRPAGLGLLMRACMAAAVSGDPGAIHGMLAELDTEPRTDAERFPSLLMNGISRLIAGDAAAGVASIEEALALADDIEVVEQVQQAGGGAIFLGDWVRARRYFDRATVLARDHGAIAAAVRDPRAARAHRPVGAPARGRGRRRGRGGAPGRRHRRRQRPRPAGHRAGVAGRAAGRRGGVPPPCRRGPGPLARARAGPSGRPGDLGAGAARSRHRALGRGAAAPHRHRGGAPGLRAPVPARAELVGPPRGRRARRASGRGRAHARALRPVGGGRRRGVGRARAGRLPRAGRRPRRSRRALRSGLESVDRAGPLDRARIHLHYGEYLRRERRRSTRACTCAPPSTASSGSARRRGPSARCASCARRARRPASAT